MSYDIPPGPRPSPDVPVGPEPSDYLWIVLGVVALLLVGVLAWSRRARTNGRDGAAGG